MSAMIRKRVRLIGLGLLIAAAALSLWYRSWANPLRYPVQGVDISHHQGGIDWTLLSGAEIDFAYIKATEGGDWIDPAFARNWAEAKRTETDRGAYHYFSTCRAGALQAENFLKVVGPAPDALPAALDLEYGGFCGAPPDKTTLMREASIWIERVEAATGKPVIIYTTGDFHDAFLTGEFENQPFWLRSIGRPPAYEGRKNWTLWQWHHAGRLPGVKGAIDRNAFYGTAEEFAAFADVK